LTTAHNRGVRLCSIMATINLNFGPWSDFVAHLQVPKDAETVQKRINVNLSKWKANYAAVACLVTLLFSYFYQELFVVILITAIVGALLFFLKVDQVGSMRVTSLHKQIAVAVVLLFGIWVTETFQPVFWAIALSAVLVAVHASFKDVGAGAGLKSKLKDARNTVEGIGDDIKGELKKMS